MTQLWQRLLDLLNSAPCPVCGKWSPRREWVSVLHRIAGWVDICPACYRDLYGGEE